MARFPKSESDIAALARRMITGFTTYAEDFPDPPVSPQELGEAVTAYDAAKDAAVQTEAAAQVATGAKDERLDELVDLMKSDLRYAENTVRRNPEKLNNLGWAARKESVPLDAPGQVRTLGVSAEGPGWLVLEWKVPSAGGAVSAYKIQRSAGDVEHWEDVGIAVEPKAILSGQERGVKFVYQVIAVNKAGEGTPSNIVTVVL